MTFLKSLWADMIEKRLWPIALVLLVALVAVPVFLGSGGEDPVDVAALGATGATGGLGAQAQVSLDEPGATRLDREGKLRDPFKQQAVPDTGTSGATGAAATPATGTGTGTGAPGSTGTDPAPEPTTPGGSAKPDAGKTGGGSSSGDSSGGGDPTPKPDTKPSAPALSDYVTEIRLGRSGDARSRRTVARLTPLATVEQPFSVYLGVLTDRRTAVFLLSSDVKASGPATCKPDKTICETIEMRAGQTAKLTVTNDDGSVTVWKLTVDDVRRRGTASRTTAESRPAAKKASADEELGTDRYTYDDDTGLLRRVRASKSAKLGAHLPGAEGTTVVDVSKLGAGRVPALPDAGLWAMPAFSPLL